MSVSSQKSRPSLWRWQPCSHSQKWSNEAAVSQSISAAHSSSRHSTSNRSAPANPSQWLELYVAWYAASTMMGLEKELKEAAMQLRRKNPSSISLAAGCELFTRHVTRTSLDNPVSQHNTTEPLHKHNHHRLPHPYLPSRNSHCSLRLICVVVCQSFAQCVSLLVDRGQSYFTSLSVSARSKIANSFSQFIHPGHRILVHGFSRVVLASLRHASQLGLSFSVLTTEARPYCDGYRVVEELTALGIHVTLILDSAIAYAMERVDIVMVGAEGVAESGGIINKTGTYTAAIIAKQFSKPLYVCAECYKFTRLFPLSQRDLPETRAQQRTLIGVQGSGGGGGVNASEVCAWPEVKDPALFAIDHPQCDYTPPQYVSLLFTDLGILTPSAISDELIKLYY